MRRDLVFLSEMIDAAEQAMALVAGRSIGDIEGDRRTRDALLWNVTVLGEAANRVSELTRNRFPGIPWQEPTRLRNRVVHGYWSIDVEIVHTTATDKLPDLVAMLRAALAELSGDDAGESIEPHNQGEA